MIELFDCYNPSAQQFNNITINIFIDPAIPSSGSLPGSLLLLLSPGSLLLAM
jgi:hypothetical protein